MLDNIIRARESRRMRWSTYNFLREMTGDVAPKAVDYPSVAIRDVQEVFIRYHDGRHKFIYGGDRGRFHGFYDPYDSTVQFILPIDCKCKVVESGPRTRRQKYFECPISKARVRRLYYYKGHIGSAKALGLKRSAQQVHRSEFTIARVNEWARAEQKPALETRRETYAALAVRDPLWRTLLTPEAEKMVERDRLRRSAPRPPPKSPPLGFLKGLAQEVRWEGGKPGTAEVDPIDPESAIDIVENYPCLDIRELARLRILYGPFNKAFEMDWSERTGRPEDRGRLDVILQNSMFNWLIWSSSGSSSQRLNLHRQLRGPKVVFYCPVTNKSVQTLYWRFGRWASREAQRLVNASQRKRSDQSKTSDAEPSS